MQLPHDDDEAPPADFAKLRSRIMYIEDKSGGLTGPARIGRVYFSRSGKTLYYAGRRFRRTQYGFKSNYFDIDSDDQFWVSGPRKDQNDRLHGGFKGVEIDEDVREEYARLLKEKGK